jgi:aspartyl-tRNA(Asn)/glutamyl-tRNA(Gln) amidotransferase subunit A
MQKLATDEWASLPIEQAANLLRRRKISPAELTNAALAKIEKLNPQLNAFITVTAERALREARAAEREIHGGRGRGHWRGPLHGIPVALKDNFCTRGVRTTAGSKILADYVPEFDSDAATRLARAGAILVGKTNMHEFAYGITNENPHYGAARNPWGSQRMSGGSSGGSAVAVATGMCMAALGTDTGGSIRIPASLCGVTGLKPTFGLVSVQGTIPLCESLDHVGPIARSAVDCCIVLETIAGDRAWPNGTRRPRYMRLRRLRPKRLRIGWPAEFFFDAVDGEVRARIDEAMKMLRALGARIVEISLPHLEEANGLSTSLALAEATRYHQARGFFPARANEYGEDVRARLEMGATVPAVDYLRARDVKRELTKDFDAAFEGVDAIVAPASPIPASRLGETEVTIGGEKEAIRSALVRLNRPANFTGHPAMSVPCGFTSERLPVGLQLIGPRYGEEKLLAIGAALETTNFSAV